MSDPFDGRRKTSADAVTKAEAEEKIRLQGLMETEPGRWILARLLGAFEAQVHKRCSGHNSADSYEQGRLDVVRDYRDLVIKHFGHAAIDKILKGKI